MADEGWLKLYRELKGKPIWKKSTPGQKSALITMLMMASHNEHSWEWNGKPYRVKPGQFISSPQKIAEEAGRGVTRQIVRGALNRFSLLGFLTYQATNDNTLVTIENWAKYQSSEKFQPTAKPNDNQATTTTKNVRSKEVKDTSISSTDSEIQENFEKLWKLYPNKKGKQLAYRHYRALAKKSKDPLLNRNIQNGIVAYKRYLVESGTEPQYVKQGGTFFNQESWSDDWSLSAPQETNPEPQKMSRKQFVLDYLDSNRGDVEAALKEMDLDGVDIDQTEARRIMEGGLTNAN